LYVGRLRGMERKYKIRTITVFIIIFCVTAFFIFQNNEKNGDAREIVSPAFSLIDQCKQMGSVGDYPAIKGKIIVWDMKTDSKSSASIPASIAWNPNDNILTLFLIVEKGENTVGYYEPSGGPAIQPYADIAVVYWPSLEPVGFYRVLGTDPPTEIMNDYSASGNLEKGIEIWLKNFTVATPPNPYGFLLIIAVPVAIFVPLIVIFVVQYKRSRH
jgi:hypothetical protein